MTARWRKRMAELQRYAPPLDATRQVEALFEHMEQRGLATDHLRIFLSDEGTYDVEFWRDRGRGREYFHVELSGADTAAACSYNLDEPGGSDSELSSDALEALTAHLTGDPEGALELSADSDLAAGHYTTFDDPSEALRWLSEESTQ